MARKQNKVKLCLWTHVQNEAPVIERMLKSAVDYIDYWVLVDNGSTDGTQDIIKDFFEKEKIPGKLYQSKIGWKGHGINRQHSWEFLTDTAHGCDYILRIDADEGIEVDEDFDWSIVKDQGFDSWSMNYNAGNHVVPRMWLWKASLPWFWADDVAHETIHLKKDENSSKEETRAPLQGNMPHAFRHVALGSSHTSQNPIKFLQDVLKLENQLHERFRDGTTLNAQRYHLFYLAKSFNYTGFAIDNPWCFQFFPYGKDHVSQFLKRGLFYWNKYLETFEEGHLKWYTYFLRGQIHFRLHQFEEAIEDWRCSALLNPSRMESSASLFSYFYQKESWDNAFLYAFKIKNTPCPLNTDPWHVELGAYFDQNEELRLKIAHTFEVFGQNHGIPHLIEDAKTIRAKSQK